MSNPSDGLNPFGITHYEHQAIASGYTRIAGIDEAGRGALCGPVCAAAVVLNPATYEQSVELFKGINDSKQLSDKKRRTLFGLIYQYAEAVAVSFIDNCTIDKLNILNATYLAFENAFTMLKPMADYALIDGNPAKGLSFPHQCIVKGDSKSLSIMAASIIAKVSRDNYMLELDKQYPAYQLAKHKGYGTKTHYDIIRQFGANEIYRKTFRLYKDYTKGEQICFTTRTATP